MSKTKTFALFGMLTLMSVGLACSSGVGEKTGASNTPAPAPKAPAAPTSPAAPTATIAGMTADTQQIFSNKCAMCHGQDAKGMKAAPNLFEVRAKHTSAEWEAYLKDPKIWEKDNTMPKIPLEPEQSKKLADWLAETTGKPGAKGESGEHDGGKDEKGGKTEGMKKS